MLHERYRRLLTAYVDGELTSRQRGLVARLLRRSQEARQLLQQLQGDAETLRHLPQPQLPADFTSIVLNAIAESRLKPVQPRIAKAYWPVPRGPMVSWAAAAAVLLVLGVASYLYFAASLSHSVNLNVAQQNPTSTRSKLASAPADLPQAEKARKPSTTAPQHPAQEMNQPVAVKPPVMVERRAEKPDRNASVHTADLPQKEAVLTERIDTFQLERVRDMLPVIVKVSDLEQQSSRNNLIAELRKDRVFRMELPCLNGTKALQRIQSAAQTLQVGLVFDKHVQERIKIKMRRNYLLFLENVTPEELTVLVRQIGVEDRKQAANKPSEAQIDSLVLTRLSAKYRKELATLLGIDPASSVPAATGPLGMDLRKPLPDVTARELEKALAGQGGRPRPEIGKPTAKPPKHHALVLLYNPAHPGSGSEEIKRFLEGRKPTRPGTIRVFLVLRG